MLTSHKEDVRKPYVASVFDIAVVEQCIILMKNGTHQKSLDSKWQPSLKL
jgi:hypothetical protein